MTTYANRPALQFEDAEGLRLVLLVSNGEKVEHWETWEKSEVPAKHQIQGMGSVEMTVRRLDKMASTLTEMFGYTEVSRNDQEAIFQSIKGETFGEIVVKYLDGPTEKPGRGKDSPFSNSREKRCRACLLGRTGETKRLPFFRNHRPFLF